MFIEDILHNLVDNLEVNPEDSMILSSISRQIKKGKAFTDRQHALVKTKLLEHQSQFEFDINPYLDNLKTPLREVDRSQYVIIVDNAEKYGESKVPHAHESWKWIKVRFPFSKKTIQAIEKLSSQHRNIYDHKRGTHEHYFRLTETAVRDVVQAFINKQFDIDSQLLAFYNEIVEIENNKDTYLTNINNLSDNALKLISEEIGSVNDPDNLLKLCDRKRRYGINDIKLPTDNTLAGKIALRPTQHVNLDPELYNIHSVAESLIQLERFPLLVVIDQDDALLQLTTVYNAFSYLVPREQQSALFRVDTQNNKYSVNNFIHDNQLNNWVDSNTKIVYISKTKLPKLLLKTEWKPIAMLAITGTRCHTMVDYYIKDQCDLIVYHDKESSLFNIKRSYGYL